MAAPCRDWQRVGSLISPAVTASFESRIAGTADGRVDGGKIRAFVSLNDLEA